MDGFYPSTHIRSTLGSWYSRNVGAQWDRVKSAKLVNFQSIKLKMSHKNTTNNFSIMWNVRSALSLSIHSLVLSLSLSLYLLFAFVLYYYQKPCVQWTENFKLYNVASFHSSLTTIWPFMHYIHIWIYWTSVMLNVWQCTEALSVYR